MKTFIPYEDIAGAAIGCPTPVKKTTHLAIAAHQDDVEIMAQHGILECFGSKDKHFSAVICTDGAGSPRDGIYKDYTNEEMMKIRAVEQEKAAVVGEYAALYALNFPSSLIKDGKSRELIDKLKEILIDTKPDVIYTHNPADKHDTHVAVVLRVLTAIREIKDKYKPKEIYGCEVWRGLDWVNDDEKKVLDVSGHSALKASLLGVFDSQIAGGKRYDIAALGRFASNATFFASHATDAITEATYALDLMPILEGQDVAEFINGYIERFKNDITDKINKFSCDFTDRSIE